MKLKLVVEGVTYWIVGNPNASERVMASDSLKESLNAGRTQQVVPGSNWHKVDVRDQCNQRLSIDMECRRIFADEWERLAFMARVTPEVEDDALHPWIGELWLRVDHGAWAWSERKITKGILSLVGTAFEGECSVLLTYRVQTGGLSAETRSGVSDFILDHLGQPIWDDAGFYITTSEHEE